MRSANWLLGGALMFAVGGVLSTPVAAYTGQELASEARISLDAARAIALSAVPDTITDQELEREPVGSGLRYSFDVKSNGLTREIGVDAKTGTVLQNADEGRHSD